MLPIYWTFDQHEMVSCVIAQYPTRYSSDNRIELGNQKQNNNNEKIQLIKYSSRTKQKTYTGDKKSIRYNKLWTNSVMSMRMSNRNDQTNQMSVEDESHMYCLPTTTTTKCK